MNDAFLGLAVLNLLLTLGVVLQVQSLRAFLVEQMPRRRRKSKKEDAGHGC